MQKSWIIIAVIVAWIVLVPFLGVIRSHTSHDADGNVRWYDLCLEYPAGSDCIYVPKFVVQALMILGVRHSDTTDIFENEEKNAFQ